MGALSRIPGPWLDVTRTLTRIGRGAPTGIDRVELEYIAALLEADGARFVCRTTRGYLLLDASGAERLFDIAMGRRPIGQADIISRVTFRGQRPRHRVEADLREVAIDRCAPRRLGQLLARHPAAARTYINIGHSNLSDATLSAFACFDRSIVMIHDLIPVTHPDLVADTQPRIFADRIARVRRFASHVIANSNATADALQSHWADEGRAPQIIVAHLGVDATDPPSSTRDPMHFVMLGTIEPRKNHALMIDVWEAMAKRRPPERMPNLHIIGNTGWKVADLMRRIEAHPLLGRSIFLHGPLPDTDVRAHLAKAGALLFPSLVEGYGFPPLEAAMSGAVPVCHELPVFRETLGDCAVYVNNLNAYHWQETIEQLIDGTLNVPDLAALNIPTWQEHFEIVADAVRPQETGGRP